MRKTRRNGLDVWTIRAADGSVQASVIPEMGAAVSSLRIAGRELLYRHSFFWDPKNAETRGGFPFHFPICGRLERGGQANAWLYDAHIYRMPCHGFSMQVPWTVVDRCRDDELTIALRDSPQTRRQYPFAFRIALRFRAVAGFFIVEQEYRNTGTTRMPYNAGFHPYFLTPPAGPGKEKTLLDFRPTRRILYNDALTDIAGETRPARLPVSVADPSINEMLSTVGRDKETRLRLPDGFTIHMTADGVEDPDLFPYVQLYTMPEKPFFCVEPWMGFPNALNSAYGPRWLAPGQTEHGVLKVWASGVAR